MNLWLFLLPSIISRPCRSWSAAAYSDQTFPWTIWRSVHRSVQCIVEKRRIGPDAVWHHRSDRSRDEAGTGFGDRSIGRATFRGDFGARHCNQWGLYGVRVGQWRDAALFPNYFGQTCCDYWTVAVVGYGHITPKTSWGQVVTILYAIFGIPLTLFTITNLGSIMATAFRFIYKYICCGLCCVCCSGRKRWRVARRRTVRTTTRQEGTALKDSAAGGGISSVADRGRRWLRGRIQTRARGNTTDTSDDQSRRKTDETQLTWREHVLTFTLPSKWPWPI